MTSAVQFNFISFASIILLLQLFSNISYAGMSKAEEAIAKYQHAKDRNAIETVIRQADKFEKFFVPPDRKDQDFTEALPEDSQYPLSSEVSDKASSMLNTIFVFKINESVVSHTPFNECQEQGKIKEFFQKLKDRSKNDLSEMDVVLNRKLVNTSDYFRNDHHASPISRAPLTAIIDAEMNGYRASRNTTQTLLLMLSFLSAADKEKEKIEDKLGQALYFDTSEIGKSLDGIPIPHPDGEGISTLTELIQNITRVKAENDSMVASIAPIIKECKTNPLQDGRNYNTDFSPISQLQAKKNHMIVLLKNSDQEQLKKEIPFAIKGLRNFRLDKNRLFKLGYLCDLATLAFDEDPNDYQTNMSM